LSIIDPFLWIVAIPNNIVTIYASFILFGIAGNQGIVNAGYLTSCLGMILDQSEEESKSIYTSMYFLVVGLAVSIAPIIGGLIIKYFDNILMNISVLNIQLDGYKLLFIITAILLILAFSFSLAGNPSIRLHKKLRHKDKELC
jgi:MFS family permease